MLDERHIDDPFYALAERIKRERSERGLTRQQLATRVGVSRTTILNWESGRRIPVEKCAALAEGLGVATEELLELHPEVPTMVRPRGDVPGGSDGFRVTKRELAMVLVGVVAVVIGMGFLAWSTATSTCFEVGAGLGSAAPAFRSAFDEAGSRDQLGCPVGEVRKWGEGVTQSLEGGSLGMGVILSLDRLEAYVLVGTLYEDWRWTADGAAADVAGYPTSPPLSCAGTIVLPLHTGFAGPGGMVQSAGGDGYEWIYGDPWQLYVEAGGPAGPLGRPTGPATRSVVEIVAEFEGGTIRAPFGAAPVLEGDSGEPLQFTSCSPVEVASAARP